MARTDIRRKWNSLTEFINYGDRANNSTKLERASRRVEDEREHDCWSGAKDWSSARRVALDGGWTHPALAEVDAIVEDVRVKVADSGVVDTFTPMWDTAGSMVDVGAYCGGSPEHMIAWQPVADTSRGKVVRIAYNVTVSSDVDTDVMIRKGATILALCDILATLGFTAEIWAVECVAAGTGTGSTWAGCVRVKAASETYDRGDILFALAHPSMLRRAFFAANEQEPVAVRKEFRFHAGYGRVSDSIYDDVKANLNPDVVIGSGLRGDNRKAINDPVGWVLDQLTGLELIDAN
jgi:hypothetical protein